jgi:hypothetical protein
MTDELQRMWKEPVVTLARKYSDICLERLRKPTKTISSRCPGRDSNRALREHKYGAIPPRQLARVNVGNVIDVSHIMLHPSSGYG